MLLPIIAVMMLSISSTLGAKAKRDDVERGNAYYDEIITDFVQNHGDEYDPFPMNDSAVGFNRKVLFVNVTGEAKLFNGHVSGLRTLHREGDTSLNEKDGRIYLDVDVGVGVVNLFYDGTVKFMNLGPTVTIHGSVNYIQISCQLSVDSKTGKDGKIRKFKIDDMRGMKVKVSGLGPLNWAVNPILSGVTKVFKRHVKRLLENKIVQVIDEELPKYQFPVEGNDDGTSGTDSSIGEEVSETVNPETTKIPVTEEPFTEEETEEPIIEEETEEPVTEEETEEPIIEEETEEPIIEEETEEPIVEEETEEPIVEEETEEPIVEEETEEPIVEEETEEPIIEDETEEPVIEEETEEPVAEEETEPEEIVPEGDDDNVF